MSPSSSIWWCDRRFGCVDESTSLPSPFLKMKVEEVNQCQIQVWYPKFRSASIKTLIHELPESFVEYLLDDSGPFLLPQSVLNDTGFPNRVRNPLDEEDYQISEGGGGGSEDDDSESEETSPPPPSFPDLELRVKESIESLGGAVFPKLNWSAPKDSAWISSTGTLRCSSLNEIALLLRSSDAVVHDLCNAYDSCVDNTSSRPARFFLALRKWYPLLRPEMEFRCFVRGRKFIGISQREVTGFYPALLEMKNDIASLIQLFLVHHVCPKFELENYVVDVYVTKDWRAKIVDFNPWGGFTLPLLFTWEELEQNSSVERESVEFRIVESQCTVRPGLKTAVPYDYLDTSPGSGWDQIFRKSAGELQQQSRSPQAVMGMENQRPDSDSACHA